MKKTSSNHKFQIPDRDLIFVRKGWNWGRYTISHCYRYLEQGASFATGFLRWYCNSRGFPIQIKSILAIEHERVPGWINVSTNWHTSLSNTWPTVLSRFLRTRSRATGSTTSLRWISMPITAGTSRSWRVRPSAGNARDAHRSQEFLMVIFFSSPRYPPVKNVLYKSDCFSMRCRENFLLLFFLLFRNILE